MPGFSIQSECVNGADKINLSSVVSALVERIVGATKAAATEDLIKARRFTRYCFFKPERKATKSANSCAVMPCCKPVGMIEVFNFRLLRTSVFL
ncbi:MAG: hypothetical protein JWO95_2649 [Verrucomicrobiales bacterium]|nr:hypothetical protein [Verrucomicrobiales bacterium]